MGKFSLTTNCLYLGKTQGVVYLEENKSEEADWKIDSLCVKNKLEANLWEKQRFGQLITSPCSETKLIRAVKLNISGVEFQSH